MPANKKILIHAVPGDLHSLLVQAALAERGHHTQRFLASEIPLHTDIELRFDAAESSRRIYSRLGSFDLDGVDAVWIRRTGSGSLPHFVCSEDRPFARQELGLLQSSLRLLADDAFCVNPWFSARRADHKPLQLQHARALGMTIPATLISNNPQAIRQFIASHDEVIYKPLRGTQWQQGEQTFGTYTAPVREQDLPSDRLLRCTPGIFQRRVHKQFEVRAQFFGASCFAIALDSAKAESAFDWRMNQGQRLSAGRVELPSPVHAHCRALMKSLDIVSGAFDFIVTADGEWVFLEVNEGGQFLFLELWCPQLTLIDAFCDFLESGDPDFAYCPRGTPQNFAALQRDHDLTHTSACELADAAVAPRVPEAMA